MGRENFLGPMITPLQHRTSQRPPPPCARACRGLGFVLSALYAPARYPVASDSFTGSEARLPYDVLGASLRVTQAVVPFVTVKRGQGLHARLGAAALGLGARSGPAGGASVRGCC